MNSKRIIVLILIILAVPLYIYDVLLVIPQNTTSLQEPAVIPVHTERSYRIIPPVVFTQTGKSPFLPFKEEPKPIIKTVTPQPVTVTSKPKETVSPPRIVITGIMWNPTNPVVMLNLPDGSSAMAKSGQTLMGAVTITKIDQHSIDVLYKDVKFTIRK